ncbi:MAG: PD-(D/E)XK nuclease family protein [Candidatus Colwellbacteria bacterium]|nr:PD-(D/E)XK nuclease family protein [Candidatus Colwellbacteria bacterium]
MAYNGNNRYKTTFDPKSTSPFKLSRSKIELFTECPRCFYLDRRLGISRPSMPAFTLNNAVDTLLKKEFDIHRANGSKHPLMEHYAIDAVPYPHKELDVWRNNFKGIQYLHKPTNLLITGAIDDIWINPKGELIIVDYKATATEREITMEGRWKEGYKRQMEIYQWLFRQNGFKVADIGYFVYVNGKTDRKAFDKKLEFDVQVFPHNCKDAWIPETLQRIKKCLVENSLPKAGELCEYCPYREAAKKAGT